MPHSSVTIKNTLFAFFQVFAMEKAIPPTLFVPHNNAESRNSLHILQKVEEDPTG